jgi:REP element-mobilizing transposase RayT
LKGFDYSQPGGYYVTIGTHRKQHVFGAVINGQMRLSPIGTIASQCWLEIPRHVSNIQLDQFVIMPNHVHGILIWFDDTDVQLKHGGDSSKHRRDVQLKHNGDSSKHRRGVQLKHNGDSSKHRRDVQLNAPTEVLNNITSNLMKSISPPANTLSVIVRTFKAAVTTWCRRNGYEHFRWQRNFYEHVIRNDHDLNRIREYIHNNPMKWHLDEHLHN